MNDKKNGYFAHESAYVDEGAEVGDGSKIWHFSHILSGARIGRNCNIGQNVVIHSTAILGNNVKVQNNVSVYDAVELGDDVFCGPSCVFTNVTNPRSAIIRKDEYKKTFVEKGATLGANSTILCGITIGANAFIGAGAVVTSDVAPYALMLGVPAKRTGWICSCGAKLTFSGESSSCSACSARYRKNNPEVIEPL